MRFIINFVIFNFISDKNLTRQVHNRHVIMIKSKHKQ